MATIKREKVGRIRAKRIYSKNPHINLIQFIIIFYGITHRLPFHSILIIAHWKVEMKKADRQCKFPYTVSLAPEKFKINI
jgi:hypothetical protein